MRQAQRIRKASLHLEALEVRENLAPTLLGSTSLPGAGSPWDFSRGPFGAALVFADLEGDGPQEILTPGGDGNLHAYRLANNRLELVRTFATGQASQMQATPMVVDLPGGRAVFAGNVNGWVFGWNARTGQALPGWPANVHAATAKPDGTGLYGAVAAGDLDGDGIPEILTSAFNHEITAFRANGTVMWQFNNDDTVLSSVAIGDLNRDGRPEVVVGGDSAASQFYWSGGRINVLSADGRRVWVKQTDQVIWSSPILVDLNADGYLEVVVGTGYFYQNRGNRVYALDHLGNDVPGWPYVTDANAAVQAVTHSSPAAADLDGDGSLEIVIADGVGKLHAIRGNGQALWAVQAFDRQNLWTSPVIADINGDNRPDVLLGAEGFLRGFDGRTGSRIWESYTSVPHYSAGAVGRFRGDSSWQAAFVGWARSSSGALLAPSSLYVYNLDPTTLQPPWAMFRQDHTGNAVARPDSSVTPLITKLYQVVLTRNPAQSEVDSWLQYFRRAQNLQPLIHSVTGSYEARGLQIQSWYTDYLRRQPEKFGIDGWQAFLAAGNSYNTARAGIIASVEAFNNAGGTNTGWVTYLYQTLLGRTPGTGEADGWLQLLNSGQLNRSQLVPRFQGAPETLQRLINSWYAGFTPNGQSTAATDNLAAMSWDIRRGKPEEQVLRDMLTGNGDYLTLHNEGTWIRALYQDLLLRQPGVGEMTSLITALEVGQTNYNAIASNVVRSNEYNHVLVDSWFRKYLRRASSEGERAGLVNALNGGARRVDLIAGLLQGEEYFNLANRDIPTFIRQTLTDLWGYGPTPELLATWQGRANVRTALSIEYLSLTSNAYYMYTIDNWYLDLFGRLPSTPLDQSRLIAAGVPYGGQNWINFWTAGGNPADIQVSLVVSPEYQSLARTKAFWTGARWLS